MELGGHRASVPLYESGDAPRFFVTDVDRIENPAEGVYTFVCTRTSNMGGREERQVVLYIDATPAAICRGIILSFFNVKGLMERLRASRFLTFH